MKAESHPSQSTRALRGFAVQFITLTVLPLTAWLIVIALGSITIHQREMRALVAEQDERAVRAAALSERLTHRAVSLRALADRAGGGQPQGGQPQGLPLRTILAESAYLVADFDGGVAFYSPQIDWLAASTPEADWAARPIEALIAQTTTTTPPPRMRTVLPDMACSFRRWLITDCSQSPTSEARQPYRIALQKLCWPRRCEAFVHGLHGLVHFAWHG